MKTVERKSLIGERVFLSSYAFENLGFHRVSIGVVGLNKNALRFWKSLGFKREGVERHAHFYDNKYSDSIMMSILENEYRNTRTTTF